MPKLLIVESPTKAKTIRRFLPTDRFDIMACMGHIRDLPSKAAEIPKKYRGQPWSNLGVQVDKGFEPIYIVPTKKREVVKQLKMALSNADELYIATDEDREGEAIGWHLLEALKPKVPVRRMVFHEITKPAITRALEQTRNIDHRLVDAQETRRVLDRLVGYKVSPVLWRKIAKGLSAGRVQSVAVRLLVNREKERMAFVSGSYWSVTAQLSSDGTRFGATLTHLDGQRIAVSKDFDESTGELKASLQEKGDVVILDEERAKALEKRAPTAEWHVTQVKSRDVKRSPSAPFITSTLQQEASRKFGWSAKKTMMVAQKLYEEGKITYMRTDSVQLSNEAVQAARKAARERYGSEYLPHAPRQYRGKVRNAQEAHEAIRPAGNKMIPASELRWGNTDQKRLYDLIWKRTVACQMTNAKLRQMSATIAVSSENALFRATGQTVLFPGFMRAYVEGDEDPQAALAKSEKILPPLQENDRAKCHGLKSQAKKTNPPARFTEASLIKRLEEAGVGRPSTYASVMERVQDVGYAQKTGRALAATFTAFAANNLLEVGFDRLVDTGFTAKLEKDLDDIATGSGNRLKFLSSFYGGPNGLEARVEGAQENVDPRQISTVTSARWNGLEVRVGRYGPFIETEADGTTRRVALRREALPGDITYDELQEVLRTGRAPSLGVHPETGEEVSVRNGPYGPYVQLGEGGRPRRVSIPNRFLKTEDVTFEIALKLLELPREIGVHPKTSKTLSLGIGRYGPYVRMEKTYASLRQGDDLFAMSLERAVELIDSKGPKSMKVLGQHPETGADITMGPGRYGPYVKHKKTNASLKKGQSLETLTLEEAVKLIDAKAAQPKRRKRTTRTRRRTRAKK